MSLCDEFDEVGENPIKQHIVKWSIRHEHKADATFCGFNSIKSHLSTHYIRLALIHLEIQFIFISLN